MIDTIIDPGTALASCFHALSKSKACWFSINTDYGGYSLASALQLSLSDTAYLLFTLGLVSKAKRGNKLTMNTSKWNSYLILHDIKNAEVNQFKMKFGSERINFFLSKARRFYRYKKIYPFNPKHKFSVPSTINATRHEKTS